MSGIAGILNTADSQHAFIANVGQALVFDAVNTLLDQYNEEINASLAVFVEKTTEDFKVRYLLPGGGYLQEMGRQAPAAAAKAYGYYDVAFPLRMYGVEVAGDRVDLAYLTIAQMDVHLKNVMTQDLNTMRLRILTSLFEDTNLTYIDEHHGTITICRLANTDGTLYPPVLGTQVEADDHHYIYSGYDVADIAAGANNPAVALRDEISEHFGGVSTSGRQFVYFHGADQTAYLEAIAGFVPVSDRFIQEGADTATTGGWPNVPGRIHGRGWGVWLSEWDGWIPDKFGIEVLMDVPAPLVMRVDPAATGLGQGLQLVAKDVNHPMQRSSFEHRYGFGCGNRLSAACISICETGSYVPPTAYDE